MQGGIDNLRDWVLSQPYGEAQNVYAVLDSARDPNIFAKLDQRDVEFVSLYRGEPEETLAEVAPYLVSLGTNLKVLNWILGEGWGQGWGIFVISPVSMDVLRRHFRHFLLVLDPLGKELYFRFYDPRVLRVYLPTCTGPETSQFFGQVTSFFMESEDSGAVLEFTKNGLKTTSLLKLSPSSSVDTPIKWDDVVSKSNRRRVRIREEQMNAFSQYMHGSFDKRAAVHLRKEYPAETETKTDTDLLELIQQGTEMASRYQFIRESEIAVFLDLMILFDPRFDETTEWAREILANSRFSSDERLQWLREHRDSEIDRRKSKDNE